MSVYEFVVCNYLGNRKVAAGVVGKILTTPSAPVAERGLFLGRRSHPSSRGGESHTEAEGSRLHEMPFVRGLLYRTLVINDPVEPVDLIIVMAGRMERKQYGLNLFRSGLAPRLLLSIGRFEVSKMAKINLDGLAELRALRDRLPPDDRHFFTTVDSTGVRHENVKLRRWSTYGEALALRTFLTEDAARRVMIISTDLHLRRVALTFAKVFRDTPFQFSYCAVPQSFSPRHSRRFVFSELVKLIGYRTILSLPVAIAHPLLRLKSRD